jgi:hypothetical protein
MDTENLAYRQVEKLSSSSASWFYVRLSSERTYTQHFLLLGREVAQSGRNCATHLLDVRGSLAGLHQDRTLMLRYNIIVFTSCVGLAESLKERGGKMVQFLRVMYLTA